MGRIERVSKVAMAGLLSAIALALSSSVSSAALVTYNYTGVWDVYQYSPGGPFQTLDPATVGATFSGTVTLDTDYPDWHGGPYTGTYANLPGYPGTISLDFGRRDNPDSHYAASLTGVYVNWNGEVQGFNPLWGEMWRTGVAYGWPASVDGVPVAGGQQFAYSQFEINLTNGDNSSQSILPDPFSSFASSYVLLRLHGGDLVYDPWEAFAGKITSFAPASEVPLPAALPLFAAGLGAMGFMGWRRKLKSNQIIQRRDLR